MAMAPGTLQKIMGSAASMGFIVGGTYGLYKGSRSFYEGGGAKKYFSGKNPSYIKGEAVLKAHQSAYSIGYGLSGALAGMGVAAGVGLVTRTPGVLSAIGQTFQGMNPLNKIRSVRLAALARSTGTAI